MSRIWRRIYFLYGAQNECVIRKRLTISRLLSASACRYDSSKEKEEEVDSQTQRHSQDKAASAAKDLLSTLTGLKVEKSLGSKVKSSSRVRSAAADFRDILVKKKAVDGDALSATTKRPEDVQKMVLEAVRAVAEIFPEQEVVESDLLRQLRKHDEATAAGQQGDLEAVSSILSGIKVERQTELQRERDRERSHDERALAGSFGSEFQVSGAAGQVDRTGRSQTHIESARQQHKRTLFDHPRLNIFNPVAEDTSQTQALSETESTAPSLWDKEETKHHKKLGYSTLNSGFDEMIKWTEEGKTWRYPIDNEQGLEEEQQVPFHEHIFFDHLLEDLPPFEPVRTFMELVCVGLSQNPYLTVQQKHDHVHWFKTYFKEREGVVREAVETERADEEAREVGT